MNNQLKANNLMNKVANKSYWTKLHHRHLPNTSLYDTRVFSLFLQTEIGS